jgi:hypothetical protein
VLPDSYQASRQRGSIFAEANIGRIAKEVLQHLNPTTLPRVNVKLTLEIEADAPDGVLADVQLIVTEIARPTSAEHLHGEGYAGHRKVKSETNTPKRLEALAKSGNNANGLDMKVRLQVRPTSAP